MSRIILHIDMNSYFASAEQQANPNLRGRAIAVCEHLGGLIIAPSVEAKRLGIGLGTPVWDAVKICPKIILLQTDPDKYRALTNRFLNILRDYSGAVEQYSIDEAFLDISEYCNGDYREGLFLGLEIKQRLRLEIGEWLSCSIGIGPSKLVAKIAADIGAGDMDRIFLVRPGDLPTLRERLKLTDVPGIGQGLARALNRLGVFSLSELSRYPVANLISQFGISGYLLHQLGYLRDGSSVVSQAGAVKSVGHMHTVKDSLRDRDQIEGLLFKISEKLGRRLRKCGARARTVRYFHSDRRQHWYRKQKRVFGEICDGGEIYRVARLIFSSALPLGYPLKTVGLSVSGLVFTRFPEPLLSGFKREAWLVEAMDKINDKYGECSISRAGTLRGGMTTS